MKSLLNNFVVYYDSYDEFQHKVDQYQRAIESKEWKFLTETILVIKSEMGSQMLSKEVTNMSAEDKDVLQRSYFHINQILDYLNSPVKWFKYRNRFKRVASNLKSKVKPS